MSFSSGTLKLSVNWWKLERDWCVQYTWHLCQVRYLYIKHWGCTHLRPPIVQSYQASYNRCTQPQLQCRYHIMNYLPESFVYYEASWRCSEYRVQIFLHDPQFSWSWLLLYIEVHVLYIFERKSVPIQTLTLSLKLAWKIQCLRVNNKPNLIGCGTWSTWTLTLLLNECKNMNFFQIYVTFLVPPSLIFFF